MQNVYSSENEFKCDCAACGFDPIQQLNDDIYKILDCGRVQRQFTFLDGKPIYK